MKKVLQSEGTLHLNARSTEEQGCSFSGKGDKAQALKLSSIHQRTGNWNRQKGSSLGAGSLAKESKVWVWLNAPNCRCLSSG